MNNMTVQVYWNIHMKCWSVRDSKTRLVVDHTSRMVLHDCVFRVGEKGRQRVITTGRKNVHAYVQGTLIVSPNPLFGTADDAVRISYDPYWDEQFKVIEDQGGQPVYKATWVSLFPDRVMAVGVS